MKPGEMMDDDMVKARVRQLQEDIEALNEALPKLQDVTDILNYVKGRLTELKDGNTD